jgi:hypothetical protein
MNHEPVSLDDLPRWQGSRTALVGCAVAGTAGLALTAVGYLFDARRTMLSYLVAFLYFLGLTLGMLALNMAKYAARARWHIVLRRAIEAIHAPLPALAVLFIPIALAARKIYVWIDPPAGLGEEVLRNIEHKHGYLNLPGFLWRAAIYFAIWLLISELLYRHSVAQDEDGAPHWTASNRRWGSVGLPLVALAATFAAFDWVMSLNPTWFSTLFGVYFLTGSFVAGLSLLILILAFVHEPGSFSELVKKPHFHNLGKLLFAFVCFWGYIAFSQYMLMFHANLPEEVPWFLVRTRGAWRPFALLLAFGRFIVPFFVLLSRDLKMRPKALSVVAGWLLFMHLIDLIWLVFPSAQMHDFGTRWAPANLGLHWTLITAFVGVGGVWAASALWRMRGKYLVPIGDPYLEDSLRYVQP